MADGRIWTVDLLARILDLVFGHEILRSLERMASCCWFTMGCFSGRTWMVVSSISLPYLLSLTNLGI